MFFERSCLLINCMDICTKEITRSNLLKLEKRSLSHNSVDSVDKLMFDAQLISIDCCIDSLVGVLDNWGCGGHSTSEAFKKSGLFHQSLLFHHQLREMTSQQDYFEGTWFYLFLWRMSWISETRFATNVAQVRGSSFRGKLTTFTGATRVSLTGS